MKNVILSILFIVLTGCSIFAQYISEVIEYKPAPGQFINSIPWGVSESSHSIIGGVQGTMSLGAFGGYVIFKFENSVENHSDNPYGVDFTIFGNANGYVSEPATVYVMKDVNENGLADDIWYKLAGSDSYFSSTINNYSVTYTNPNQDIASDVPWTDNYGAEGIILANSYHNQVYYPGAVEFPEIPQEHYFLSGEKIIGSVDRSLPSFVKSYQRAFGYADNNVRGVEPYTIPDNPYTSITENSGGDAFDISWAVDEFGEYIDLDQIDFVKVQNSMLGDAGWLGEISTEILGAVDVKPNSSINGETNLIVVKEIPDTIPVNDYQLEVFTFTNGRINEDLEIVWTSQNANAYVDDNNIIKVAQEGEVSFTVELTNNSEVNVNIETVISSFNSINQTLSRKDISIFPSPVRESFTIDIDENCRVEIYSLSGQLVYTEQEYVVGDEINIQSLESGSYFCRISDGNYFICIRIVKI